VLAGLKPAVSTIDFHASRFCMGAAFTRHPLRGDTHGAFTMVNVYGNRSHLSTAMTGRPVPAGQAWRIRSQVVPLTCGVRRYGLLTRLARNVDK
jgi:hypothetical protein